MNEKRPKTVGILPVRWASTRLPGKPLADIAGKPMIQRTYEQACKARLLNYVVVATDDERIQNAVVSFGGKAVMTSPQHTCGTERVAEAALAFPEAAVIVNVQGDEPLVDPEGIDAIVKAMLQDSSISMANLVVKTGEEDAKDANGVKAVQDKNGFALFCSRAQIPFPRNEVKEYLKILGVYGYTPSFLQKFAHLPPTQLEQAESVEQLRVLEYGYKLKLVETPRDFQGVNTPEELEKVRLILKYGKD